MCESNSVEVTWPQIRSLKSEIRKSPKSEAQKPPLATPATKHLSCRGPYRLSAFGVRGVGLKVGEIALRTPGKNVLPSCTRQRRAALSSASGISRRRWVKLSAECNSAARFDNASRLFREDQRFQIHPLLITPEFGLSPNSEVVAAIPTGSTGHWPVPSGDPPLGARKAQELFRASVSSSNVLPFRPASGRRAQAGRLCCLLTSEFGLSGFPHLDFWFPLVASSADGNTGQILVSHRGRR